MTSSGAFFILFVLFHMYGNLKAFAGHDAYNTYAEHLRTLGTPMLPYRGALYVIEALLSLSLVVHVGTAIHLARRAGKARTVKYSVKKNLASSFSSRTMRWGGLTIFLFVVWHLINFTIGKVNIKGGATNDPYNLLVDNFSGNGWWMGVIYLLAMLALGMHLHHGTFSACQTLGWTGTAAKRARARIAGWVLAIVISGGFSLVPIFIMAGVITK